MATRIRGRSGAGRPPRGSRPSTSAGTSDPERPRRRVSTNTAIFAGATGVSRIAGLAREVVQASFFGTTLAGSAFTIASQIPNLFSNLFSQAALGAAFVPIFSSLLQEGRRREAFKLASDIFWLILVVLGAATVVYMAAAGLIIPLFTGSGISDSLTTGLSRVLFPVVLLLSLTGLFAGILQAYDEFSVQAIAPAAWNVVIIVLMVALHGRFHGADRVYSYAIAWLVATVVQMLMVAWGLRRVDFRFRLSFDWRDPRVREVLILFFPVTMAIGIINLDAFINAELGTLVNGHAPIAINDAFRIYMLPQGIFSVAIATVLFPTLTRMAHNRNAAGMRATLGNGIRQINLTLIPCAALMAVLARPIIRLLYQHGTFTAGSTHYVYPALFWFAVSLPFAGINLLLTRTFFALQRPWIPTALSVVNIAVDLAVSFALYRPLGIAGLVIGTVIANVVMTWLQLRRLYVGFNHRLDLAQTLMITVRILAATAVATVVAWAVWTGLDAALGRGLVPELFELGIAGAVAAYLYGRLTLAMRIPEARQVQELALRRLRGR